MPLSYKKTSEPTFDEWRKDAVLPASVPSGLSWSTFGRPRDEVVAELVQDGVPLRAARDIYATVQEVFVQKNKPVSVGCWLLAVFCVVMGAVV